MEPQKEMIHEITLGDPSKQDKPFVVFDSIICKEPNEEERNQLAIIRGDLFDATYGTVNVDLFFVIENWSEVCFDESIELVFKYMKDNNLNNVPVYLVVGCDYELLPETTRALYRLGFYPADFLAFLDNNYVLMRPTNLRQFNDIAKNRYRKEIGWDLVHEGCHR